MKEQISFPDCRQQKSNIEDILKYETVWLIFNEIGDIKVECFVVCYVYCALRGLWIFLAWMVFFKKKKKNQTATTIKFLENILSNQEASICLLSLSIRGQTELNQQSQKTNQIDQMDHSLV